MYLLVIGAMVVAMVTATLVTQLVSGRDQRRQWEGTRRRYREAVERASRQADRAAQVQRAGLEGLYPDGSTLLRLARSGEGVWERRPGDEDFGSVRLGRGGVPPARPIQLAGDGSPTAEPDPALAEAAEGAVAERQALRVAPVVVPLAKLGAVAVIGSPEEGRGLVASWLAHLATFHAPGELRFVGLVPGEASWQWVKWLSHCRDPRGGEGFARARRSFSTSRVSFMTAVGDLVAERLESARLADGTAVGASMAWDHVLVFVDGWFPGAIPLLEPLMAAAAAVSVTVIVRVDNAGLVPEHCSAVVRFEAADRVQYVETAPGGRVETDVKPDRLDAAVGQSIARALAPLRPRGQGSALSVADSVRLSELLGAEDPMEAVRSQAPLRVAEVAAGRPGLLRAPVGRDDNGRPVTLDLTEAASGGMGPHGILVGATGSGKSELLTSLAMALASGHEPDLLNLLLVDYKGGAAFAGLEKLPHVAGLVTNLAEEPDLIGRVREALGGELERRQRMLRDAGNLVSIRDYHRAGGADMPYLVVIVDEFGELLNVEPDLIDTFNAIGRLGRSLGVHLLLATQRLDEGRVRILDPHLRFRIALRTYTAGESRSVLGSPAAYELPPVPGLGLLKVDERVVRFKAAMSKLPYEPDAEPASAVSEPFRLFTLGAGRPQPDGPGGQEAAAAPAGRNQLDAMVDTVADRGGRSRRIWLPPLPAAVTLGELADGSDGPLAVGLVDRPRSQAQAPLLWDPWSRHGNFGVVGAPRTGKSTLLATLVLASVARDPSVQVYCLDLGGGALHPLSELPQVGALVGLGEPDTASRLVRDLQALVAERERQRRAGFDGPEPGLVLVVVDNVGQLRQHQPDLEAQLMSLATTGLQHRVHMMVAAHRWFDMRPQLLDALGFKLEMRLGDPSESLVYRAAARALPTDRPGRGLTQDGEQFQAALPSWAPADDPLGLDAALADAVEREAGRPGALRAPRVGALAEVVHEGDAGRLAAEAGSEPPDPRLGFLLGLSEFRNRPVQLDLLAPGTHLAVFGDGGSGRTTLLRRAITQLNAATAPPQVHVVDPLRQLIDVGETVATYAVSSSAAEKLATWLVSELSARLPPEDATVADLRDRGAVQGATHVLVVDNYDTMTTSMGSPLAPLVEIIPFAADIGLHVIVARRVAGAQRAAFEPFSQRLRDMRPPTLVLSGSSDEGPVTAGVIARPFPPGRGSFVTATRPPQVVQCCLPGRAGG